MHVGVLRITINTDSSTDQSLQLNLSSLNGVLLSQAIVKHLRLGQLLLSLREP